MGIPSPSSSWPLKMHVPQLSHMPSPSSSMKLQFGHTTGSQIRSRSRWHMPPDAMSMPTTPTTNNTSASAITSLIVAPFRRNVDRRQSNGPNDARLNSPSPGHAHKLPRRRQTGRTAQPTTTYTVFQSALTALNGRALMSLRIFFYRRPKWAYSQDPKFAQAGPFFHLLGGMQRLGGRQARRVVRRPGVHLDR